MESPQLLLFGNSLYINHFPFTYLTSILCLKKINNLNRWMCARPLFISLFSFWFSLKVKKISLWKKLAHVNYKLFFSLILLLLHLLFVMFSYCKVTNMHSVKTGKSLVWNVSIFTGKNKQTNFLGVRFCFISGHSSVTVSVKGRLNRKCKII